jgi:hypothetical protein
MLGKRGAITGISTIICVFGTYTNAAAKQRTTEEAYICNSSYGVTAVCLDPYSCSDDGTADCEWAASIFGCPDMQFGAGECSNDVSNCDSGLVCYKQL